LSVGSPGHGKNVSHPCDAVTPPAHRHLRQARALVASSGTLFSAATLPGGVTAADSDNWDVYVEDNALVADFAADISTDESVFAAVNEEFERLAADPDVDTHLSVLRMDSPLNSDVFEKAREAAAVGVDHGIHSWITVSEGIKSHALKSEVGTIEGVEIETASTVEEALALADE
jgi:hypothetical protein